MDLPEIDRLVAINQKWSISTIMLPVYEVAEMSALIKKQEQALADSNLALMEQTELAERLRQQAETLEAERDRARAELEEWRFTNKIDELQREVDRHRAAPQQHAQAALSDERIESAALKHVALLFGKFGPVGDYKQTEQFSRLKAFAHELLAASQQPAAAPADSRANGNDAPAVQVQDGELLPCPFCGSAAEHYPDGEEEGYDVMCSNSTKDCKFNVFGSNTPQEAEALCNRRAALASQASKGAEIQANAGPSPGDMPIDRLIASMPLLTYEPAQAQPVADAALSQAAQDVLAERQRQVDAEGMERRYDDKYQYNELRRAAAVYACPSVMARDPAIWPWAQSWMKFTTPRRDAVKAAALLIADIERIDRALAAKPAE